MSEDAGGRVAGSAQGSFDADWVAMTAQQQDPGLPPETAALLAGQCWGLLQAQTGPPDAPELSRNLLSANSDIGATATNAVARAAVLFCETFDASP